LIVHCRSEGSSIPARRVEDASKIPIPARDQLQQCAVTAEAHRVTAVIARERHGSAPFDGSPSFLSGSPTLTTGHGVSSAIKSTIAARFL